jgi:hypothetical protein
MFFNQGNRFHLLFYSKYQQLKQEELKKIQIEEENCVLRQSIGKYSMIDSQTSWDISVKREADGISDKLSNFYSTLSPSAQLNTACLVKC